jgi:hypothetical protein
MQYIRWAVTVSTATRCQGEQAQHLVEALELDGPVPGTAMMDAVTAVGTVVDVDAVFAVASPGHV